MRKRIVGIGTITINPDPTDPKRMVAVCEITKEGAKYWDHDLLNQADMTRQIREAMASLNPNQHTCRIRYKGRTVTTIYKKFSED